jgi:DUF971 family protein
MSEPRPPSRPRPTEIHHLREEGLVRITWSDGHVGDYDYATLRGWCPCALCQGHGNERRFVRTADPRLRSIESVGAYAVNLAWSDDHDTGIYSWAYLREICPCPLCGGPRS